MKFKNHFRTHQRILIPSIKKNGNIQNFGNIKEGDEKSSSKNKGGIRNRPLAINSYSRIPSTINTENERIQTF